jgi:hypothetical protein
MFISINKGTRIIIGIMVILAAVGIVIAWIYYGNINKSVDPSCQAGSGNYTAGIIYMLQIMIMKVLALLDSIENIYTSIPHYKFL